MNANEPTAAPNERGSGDVEGTRRWFLRVCGIGVGALASGPPLLLGGCSGDTAADTAADTAGREHAARFYVDLASARAIGARWLAKHPGERSAERLLALLVPREHRATLAARDVEGVRTLMRTLHAADAAAARLEELDGWLVTPTEARLCGLAALDTEK